MSVSLCLSSPMSMVGKADRGGVPALTPAEARALAKLLLGESLAGENTRHRAALRSKGYLEANAATTVLSEPMRTLATALRSARSPLPPGVVPIVGTPVKGEP